MIGVNPLGFRRRTKKSKTKYKLLMELRRDLHFLYMNTNDKKVLAYQFITEFLCEQEAKKYGSKYHHDIDFNLIQKYMSDGIKQGVFYKTFILDKNEDINAIQFNDLDMWYPFEYKLDYDSNTEKMIVVQSDITGLSIYYFWQTLISTYFNNKEEFMSLCRNIDNDYEYEQAIIALPPTNHISKEVL